MSDKEETTLTSLFNKFLVSLSSVSLRMSSFTSLIPSITIGTIFIFIANTKCEEIICDDSNKCQNQILECSNKYEDCSFSCSQYQCQNSTFICPSTAKSCSIKCIGDHSCHSSISSCSRNSKCEIISNGKYSFANSKINGPYQQQTIIKCLGDYSCHSIWIDTKHASNLQLVCNSNSCSDLTLYCPAQNDISFPKCHIQQGNSFLLYLIQFRDNKQ